MTFYHGSPVARLSELQPFLSEHGRPYIYLSTDPLVALLYAVKPVPKPFSFYPYGFDRGNNLIYSEYYENAFYDLYKGKVGYLYECDNLKEITTPTQISCAYATAKPIKVDRITVIPDLFAFYKEQENKGLFRIKSKKDISEKEMNFVFDELRKDVENNNLKSLPQHEMSIFIKKHFPTVWETAKD